MSHFGDTIESGRAYAEGARACYRVCRWLMFLLDSTHEQVLTLLAQAPETWPRRARNAFDEYAPVTDVEHNAFMRGYSDAREALREAYSRDRRFVGD